MYKKTVIIILLLLLFYGCSNRTAATDTFGSHEIQERKYWHSYKPSLQMQEDLEKKQEILEDTK